MTATLETSRPAAGGAANQLGGSGPGMNLSQIVSFKLADEEYGLDIMKVQEIILIGQITQMPQAPDFVRGLINLRGHVIPIIDLRTRFGLPPVEKSESQRIIVVNVGRKTIGIVVDEVDQVLRVKSEDIEPPPTSIKGIDHDFICGLVKRDEKLVILLDIEHLLTETERDALPDGASA